LEAETTNGPDGFLQDLWNHPGDSLQISILVLAN